MINNDCKKCKGSKVVILPVNGETDEYPCPDCVPLYWSQGFPGVFTVNEGIKQWLWKPRRKDGRTK